MYNISLHEKEVFTLTKSLFPEALLPPPHSVYLLSRLQKLSPPPTLTEQILVSLFFEPLLDVHARVVMRIRGVAAESTPTHPSASHLLSLRSPYAETETDMLSEAKTD